MMDNLEFYDGNTLLACVASSIVPAPGSSITVRNKNWRVGSVTYALNCADQAHQRSVCATVHLLPF